MSVVTWRAWTLHLGVILILFAVQFILPAYHYTNAARIMLYAVFAIGYNILLGYTGLMSLGHAMFFASGAYGAGLAIYWLGLGPFAAMLTGIVSAFCASLAIGLVTLRTNGVAFLIVTLMMAQAAFLATLYFNGITFGDQGIVLSTPPIQILGQSLPLADPAVKYNVALAGFAISLLFSLWIVSSPIGRVMIAVRENEARTHMLGYNTGAYRFFALVVSGTISGTAGALYCLLFSYVGSSYASLQYSTLPLLWTLLGGVGTTLGPLVGTAIMFYLIDVTSGFTSSYMLGVGLALLFLTLWFPQGIVGTLRQKWLAWLP